jgi:hypothetical protein
MQTDDLISSLTADFKPTPTRAAERRLLLAVAAGAAVAFVVMLLWLGLRHDLTQAVRTPMFWVKFLYPTALATAAFFLIDRLARPGARVGRLWLALAAPAALVVALALGQLMLAAPDARLAIWVGQSADKCPWRVLVLSVPTFVALLWAFRRLAPTRPALAGLASGLGAGAVGAAVYALACDETAPAFLATWYSLGIVMAGAIGALAGKRLLRW